MEQTIIEMQLKVDQLTTLNADLQKFKQEHASYKQSLARMSSRLRKLCKRLTPTTEIVLEMQRLADEIKELIRSGIS